MHVSGPFEVKLTPQGPPDKAEGSTLGSLSIDKQFHGALEALSAGHMLSAVTDVVGSAGYVALERVRGSLQGRRGSFVLQHSATMSQHGAQLTITVVPDSGSEELRGLSGAMGIRIADGQHFYEFDYTLPDVR